MNFHKRMITIAACVNLLLIPFAISGTIADLEATLSSLKNEFLSALAKGDGVSARQAQDAFDINRRNNEALFRNEEMVYYKALKTLESNPKTTTPTQTEAWYMAFNVANSAAEILAANRVYIWKTVYEDAAKMGLSQEKIASILAADPNREKLLKLKKLKDEGLITEQEYETKRKAIINGL